MSQWESYLRAGLEAHSRSDFDEAEGLLQSALEEAEVFGFADPRLSTTLAYYATNALAKGDTDHAQMIMENTLDALAELEQKSENIDLNRATFLNNLGLIYKGQGDFGKAEESYQKALIILERYKERGDPVIAAAKSNIAVLFMLQENYRAAELLLLDALEDESSNPESLQLPTSLNQLAAAYMGQEKFDDAEKLFKRCIDHWDQHGWPKHKVANSIIENYSDLLHSQGRNDELESFQKQREAQAGD
jgi:tetratricopeptide (TPR) repeat protein